MSYCVRCHRPLRLPSVDGYGPVCRKTIQPIPVCDRDLFGYDIERGVTAAIERLRVCIESLAVDALMAVRHEAAAARRRLGVWAA
jgi:hypothetical protein